MIGLNIHGSQVTLLQAKIQLGRVLVEADERRDAGGRQSMVVEGLQPSLFVSRLECKHLRVPSWSRAAGGPGDGAVISAGEDENEDAMAASSVCLGFSLCLDALLLV